MRTAEPRRFKGKNNKEIMQDDDARNVAQINGWKMKRTSLCQETNKHRRSKRTSLCQETNNIEDRKEQVYAKRLTTSKIEKNKSMPRD